MAIRSLNEGIHLVKLGYFKLDTTSLISTELLDNLLNFNKEIFCVRKEKRIPPDQVATIALKEEEK